METIVENDPDLERERAQLIDLIDKRADAAILRALALVPDEPWSSEAATATTSTEGTGHAREE